MVLPEDSGPKISVTLPRGKPPMPSATSRASAPVDTDSICMVPFSPIRMMAPLPKFFSIWRRARSSACSRTLPLVSVVIGS